MPYVPNAEEVKRLRAAIDRAAFSEAERIMWLLAFAGLLTLDGILLAGGGSWIAILGAIGGVAVLYCRIRASNLVCMGREIHGIGLRTSAQRGFAAMMVRRVCTARNPLPPRPEHDPFAVSGQRVGGAQVSEKAGSE